MELFLAYSSFQLANAMGLYFFKFLSKDLFFSLNSILKVDFHYKTFFGKKNRMTKPYTHESYSENKGLYAIFLCLFWSCYKKVQNTQNLYECYHPKTTRKSFADVQTLFVVVTKNFFVDDSFSRPFVWKKVFFSRRKQFCVVRECGFLVPFKIVYFNQRIPFH